MAAEKRRQNIQRQEELKVWWAGCGSRDKWSVERKSKA